MVKGVQLKAVGIAAAAVTVGVASYVGWRMLRQIKDFEIDFENLSESYYNKPK